MATWDHIIATVEVLLGGDAQIRDFVCRDRWNESRPCPDIGWQLVVRVLTSIARSHASLAFAVAGNAGPVAARCLASTSSVRHSLKSRAHPDYGSWNVCRRCLCRADWSLETFRGTPTARSQRVRSVVVDEDHRNAVDLLLRFVPQKIRGRRARSISRHRHRATVAVSHAHTGSGSCRAPG